MVSILSIVFMVITLIISVGLPVALTIWIIKKHGTGFVPVAVGMLIFFVTQIVVRINIINALQMLPGVQAFIAASPVLYIIILSLTAGIFEEFGRLFGFGVMLKRRRELRHGVAFGIGHGGIEAILLVGMTYITNLMYVPIINGGTMNEFISAQLPAAQPAVQAGMQALIATPSVHFLLGGAERIFAIALHIALSVLVLYGVRKKKIGYTLLAVLLHALVDFGAVMLGQYIDPYAGLGFMLIVGVVSVIYVLRMRKSFKALDPLPTDI